MKNNIYTLYKKVFGNIVLSKIIFNFVIHINKQITSSNCNSKLPFYKTCSYEESTFNWLVINKHYELLSYKIKSNHQFKENEFTSSNLELFITHFNSNKYGGSNGSSDGRSDSGSDDGRNSNKEEDNQDILSLFYNTNKKNLIKLSKTSGSKIDLIDISIISQNLKFFKIVIHGNQIKLDLINILKLALSIGNLEIIEFIYDMGKIGSPNDCNSTIAISEFETLNCLLKSENRDNVLQFLFDKQNFKLTQPLSLFDKIPKNKTVGRFNVNFLKLQFPLFKRLIERLPMSTNLKYNKKEFKESFEILTKEISNTIISNDTQIIGNAFNKLINHLQVVFYSFSILKPNNSNYIEILDKINHLIKYNDNMETVEKYNDKHLKFSINYQEFDFIKEIKRIYIFQYIYRKSESTRYFTESFRLFLDYCTQYQEYHLITNQLKKSTRQMDTTKIYQISTKYLDLVLTESLKNCSFFTWSLPSFIDSIKPFIDYSNNSNTDQMIIEKQINYLPVLLKHGNDGLMDIFLNNLFIKFKLSINQITMVISTLNKFKKKFNAIHLIGDISIFKYFYGNQEFNCQIDWENESISISIIGIGNFEFIQYIHENNIGSINIDRSINHCKNLKTAQYMYNQLHFKFDYSFTNISELDQYNSNFLIYFGLNKFKSSDKFKQLLSMENRNNKSIKLHFDQKILKDLKLMYFIGVKLFDNDPWLIRNKVTIKYSGCAFSNCFYSIDELVKSGNIKYISKCIDNAYNLKLTKQNGYQNYNMSPTYLRKLHKNFDPSKIYTSKDKELYILYLLKQYNEK